MLFTLQILIVTGTLGYIWFAANYMKQKRTFVQPILMLILLIWLTSEVGFLIAITTRDKLQDQYYDQGGENKSLEFGLAFGTFLSNFIFVAIWLVSFIYLRSALNID